MPRPALDAALLALCVGLVATGVLGWVLPAELAAPTYPAHRILAIGLVALLAWKYGVARTSLARRVDPSAARGLLAAAALAATGGLGLAWTLGLVPADLFWGYSPLNVHVFAGFALVPFVVYHAVARPERRVLASLRERRTLLRFAGVAVLAFFLAPLTEAAGALRAVRRDTGSRHAGSFTGNAMPVTIWAFDEAPRVDVATWRLRVGSRELSYAELLARATVTRRAVLDCTSGWWSEQEWRGVALADLLEASARDVRVVSVTGHAWTFPRDDLAGAVLATHLGGEPLSVTHGFPVRLVVPGRRGFQWVKWVERIEPS